MTFSRKFCCLSIILCVSLSAKMASSCTFITLKGADGTVAASRTMEWGLFALSPAMTFVPAGTDSSAMKMPDGKDGAKWVTKYDDVGVTILDQMLFGDGMNSEGLNVSLLYLPGFAEYQKYDPAKADISLAPVDFSGFMLTQFATVAEVKKAAETVRVVPVVTPQLGEPAPVHFSVTDKTGDQIIVEFVGGELKIYDKTLGVLTNSPPYDWHISNARNYINLRSVAWPRIDVNGINLAPIGYGTGMLGLPGDFTPPTKPGYTAFSERVRHTFQAGKMDRAYDVKTEQLGKHCQHKAWRAVIMQNVRLAQHLDDACPSGLQRSIQAAAVKPGPLCHGHDMLGLYVDQKLSHPGARPQTACHMQHFCICLPHDRPLVAQQ